MKQKKTVNAIVHCIFGETPDEDKYKLQLAPPIDAHVCQQTGVEAIIRVARLEMRKEVQEDPSKPIPQIYEEVRKKTFKSLRLIKIRILFKSLPRAKIPSTKSEFPVQILAI